MNDTLAGNLEALTRTGVQPPVAGAPFRLLATDAAGDPQLRTPDGRVVRLGSARNPGGEAAALVEAACGPGPPSPAVAVIGAGTGAVIEVLAAAQVARILVIEPDPELALAWLSRRSWTDLILAGRLRLLIGPDYPGTAGAAQAVEGVARLPVVAHPVLTREYPEAMVAARQALDRVVRNAAANADARGRFEDVAFRNTLSNLPALLREADAASLAGTFAGRPAIVAGAGPSLDANVAALRPLRSSCLVIAADTAVVPCVKGGLTPHLAVALDPSPENARHLTRRAVPASVHLVCEAGVDPSVPRAFDGRTFFFRVGRHAPWPWLESSGLAPGTLDAWGSVVTAALDLAVRAGCSPILFAGLDLAFTGGQPYCRHTPLDDIWAWQVAAGDRLEDLWAAFLDPRPIVRERAVEGGDTPTASHLVAFRDWIRDYAAARPQVRFVNGTGAGILHGGAIDVVAIGDLVPSLQATATPDIAGSVRTIRTSARPPAAAHDVLTRLAGASPFELLQGHSAPHAAAGRLVAAGWTSPPVAATRPTTDVAGRQTADVADAGPAPVFLPDAARALRALGSDHRHAFPDAGQRHPARARECLDHALAAVRQAVLHDLEATRDPAFRDPRADAWTDVPAPVLVDWPRDARPIVEAATSLLHEALGSVGWPIALEAPRSAYFQSASDPRIEGTVSAPSTAEPIDSAAQTALDTLTWHWARVAAAVRGADAATARFIGCLRARRPPPLPSPRAGGGLRLWVASADSPVSASGAAVVPFLHDRAVLRAATGVLTLDPASRHAAGAPSSPRPFRVFALPGSWEPEADRLRTHQVPWSTIVEPDVLTDRGLRPCRLVATLSDTQAVLTRFDGSGSYVVEEDGRVGGGEAWPRRVDGEIALGRGGRLAWSWEGSSHVLFRPAPGTPAIAWELPVAALSAIDDGEASAILATTGGLWRWSRDVGARPVADGPELVALHREGSGVRACSPPTVLANGTRVAVDRAFDWADGMSAVSERRIPAGQACVSRSTHASWTADTLMDASAVRITHASGATFWLACSGPRSAAWAGRSLVVTLLGTGDVLLFRRLLDVVEPLVASTR